MSTQRRMVMHVAVLVLGLTLAGCSVPGLWTFEAAGSQPTTGAGTEVDPASYAESIWSSKVVPTVSEKGVDAATLLAALTEDPVAAGQEYGLASSSGGAPTFMVKGSGRVTGFDSEDPQGPLTVEVGEGVVVNIATGPVLTGTALRDAMGIGFGEFANQIDYQSVGTALNTKSKTEVIAKVDVKSLEGKTVAFEGAFAAASAEQVLIVPTKLTVTE